MTPRAHASRPRGSLAVAVAMSLVVLALKAPVVGLPYHWDELGYMVPTLGLAQEGLASALPGRHPSGTFFGHPPGLFVSLALLQRLFGESAAGAHGMALAFALLGLFFTHRLGEQLASRGAGLAAAAFLFATPIYFAQSAMALPDLPVAALGVCCVWLFLHDRRLAYACAASYAILLKETGAAIPLSLGLWLLAYRRHDPALLRKLLWYTGPLVILLLFLIAQKATTGRFVANPYFLREGLVDLAPAALIVGFAKVCGWVFVAQHRWALTLAAALRLGRSPREAWREEYTLFVLIFACFAAVFSALYVLPRYLLPVLPFLCITAAVSLWESVRNPAWRALVCAAVLVLFATGLFGAGDAPDSYSEDMQYADVVRTHREAARFLEAHHPGEPVLALWPLSWALARPELGYVARPLKVVEELARAEVVATTPQGNPGNAELADQLRRSADFVRVRRFERSGKRVDVFVRIPTAGTVQ